MLSGAVVPRVDLSAADIRRMHALMLRHYDGVVDRKFQEDLAEKDGVLLVRDPDGTIQGFSTYLVPHAAGPSGT